MRHARHRCFWIRFGFWIISIMSAPEATLIAGIIAAFVTAVGWLAVHLFTSARDREARSAASEAADRIKRLEMLLKQAEAQISQFYGPVHGLIQQIWAIWEVKEKFRGGIDGDTYASIEFFLIDDYFATYHEKIRTLMRENMHLIQGAIMPDSFYRYIKHSMMENIQAKLWKDKQIDTSAINGLPWPEDFPTDVELGLRDAIGRYDSILEELRAHRVHRDTSTALKGLLANARRAVLIRRNGRSDLR
jgi:hypothetical protein